MSWLRENFGWFLPVCDHSHYRWDVEVEEPADCVAHESCANYDHQTLETYYWRVQVCLDCGNVKRKARYTRRVEAAT